MSTTEELREVLGEHAAGVADHALHARTVAVRERVRVVRRRRRGAAAALAVVLVGAGFGVLPSLRDGAPEPAGPPHRLAGHDVPDRVTVLGFGYRYVEAISPAELAAGRVRLPATDRPSATGPTDAVGTETSSRRRNFYAVGAGSGETTRGRVVSLVTDGLGGGVATLYSGGQPVARSVGDGSLERPVPLPDEATTLRVRLRGAPTGARAALAVYRGDGRLPDGVSNGSAVFRRTVAGNDLVAARFSRPGEKELDFSFTAALGQVSFAQYCAHVPAHWQLRVSIDGDGYLASGCEADEDAGVPDFSVDAHGPARQHSVRVSLAPESGYDRQDLDAPDDAVLGLGVYGVQASDPVLHGMRVPSTVEVAGRTWGLVDTIDNGAGSHELTHSFDTGDGPLVIGYTSDGGHLGLRTAGRLVPAVETGSWSRGPELMGPDTVLLAGDRYRVTLTEERSGRTFRGALLVYAPVD